MRCPACGARYDTPSVRCPECGAIQETVQVQPAQQVHLESVAVVQETVQETKQPKKLKNTRVKGTNRSLIEFPGVTRTAIPQWRRELGERVREVQERKAREATGTDEEIGSLFSEIEPKTPALELLPQAEAAPVNPLVVAALRRIERAHSQPSGHAAVALAAVYEDQPEIGVDLAEPQNHMDIQQKPERIHNLAVVPMPEPVNADLVELTRNPNPIRIIDDANDPALNYLDSIPTATSVTRQEFRSPSLARRILSGITDLIVVCLLSSPVLLLAEATSFDWRNFRVIGAAAGAFLVVSFLYLTLAIAFTGRTIGKKLFSLRVVDARTGLIPTGSQSAGRALVYVLSLAAAGIVLIYALIDKEKQAVHDRFTRTAVIRA